ncbi:BTB domain-containing protein [Madurella fahalii]|uniref:BTB domain-containing protein n=1 Tax=Madurella fahalii TaxID=1157608 RepID=A0ABQ0FWY7_9PEZI
METQSRLRPDLRPVWTGRDQHPDYPRGPGYAARSPLYSSSFRRDSLPGAMYPASPGYVPSMRMHERALVDSLDQRGRLVEPQQSPPSTVRSLSPISEQALEARRASIASLPPPRTLGLSPRSPRLFMPYPRRQTLAAETRSILLSGLPDGLPRLQDPSADITAERRASLPSFSTARRSSQQLRQELQAWGHIYLGNGSEASCFVTAVALRRSSGGSSVDEEEATKGRPPEWRNRVTIRARVRPCELGRAPFLLRRTFDMDELRATIPEPSPGPGGSQRPSADLSHRRSLPAPRRRSSPDLDKSPVRGVSTIPIHLRYARAFFPVLAALLYSGHIRPRDIIDLPLPHPEVWGQTVAHVYTGQGELTAAIEQNILYLGGKV